MTRLARTLIPSLLSVLLAPAASAQFTPTLVADVNPAGDSNPVETTIVGNQIFFGADDGTNGQQPWVSDGTPGGTQLVKVIQLPGWNTMSTLLDVSGTLMFRANDGSSGYQIWRSDGTAAGTYMVSGTAFSASSLYEFQGLAYFNNDGPFWRSDGTLGGTGLFAPLVPGGSGHPDMGLTVGNQFYFSASASGTTGREMYISDGTVGGTQMVADVFIGTNNSTGPMGAALNGIHYWSAQDGVVGKELWRTDGTAAGTWRVKDIRPGLPSSDPKNFCASGGLMFFSAEDDANGRELWRTDGTEAGTVLVKDIRPGPVFTGQPHITSMTDVNGTLFFYAHDGVHGRELWKSDGTTAGTMMVKDLQPGGADCLMDNAFAIGNALFFTARGSTVGHELWRSDGTDAGTVPVYDLWPGIFGSQPSDIEIGDDRIYFAAEESTYGRELYSLELCELQTPETYCTPGTTANGCTAMISGAGDPSVSAGSGFVVSATAAEGNKQGLFFFGPNGRQANAWGNGTSFQCVAPPVKRSPVQTSTGTNNNCDGTFSLDFNDLIATFPAKAPPTGSLVQIQCWFRDPANTSNQSTSLSDALEFMLCP